MARQGSKRSPARGRPPGRLFLVDGSGLVFRAYFAFLRRPLTTSAGKHVGAIFGFLSTLLAMIRDESAAQMIVAFDSKGPTFRHDIYPEYKANRPPLPPELAEQLPLVPRLVEAMGVAGVSREGVEADDLIGSLAERYVAAGGEVVIVSADKDFSQLIGPAVSQCVPARGREPSRWLDADAVEEKWGVRPEQFVDYLALTGDSSDNIPGVRGVGPKTAAQLLQTHGSLDKIYADLEAVEPPAARKKLAAGREQAELSRDLVRIRCDLADLERLDPAVPDIAGRPALRAFLQEMEFRTLLGRLFPDSAAAAPRADPPAGGQLSLSAPPAAEAAGDEVAVADGWGAGYRLITDLGLLDQVLARFRLPAEPGVVLVIDTETTSVDALRADLVGISFAWEPGSACYLPLGHQQDPNLPLEGVRRRLGRLLADPAVPKAGQNLKFDLHVLERHGFVIRGPLRDTMIASYLRDPGARHGLDALAREFLEHAMVPITALIGQGKEQISMAAVPASRVAPYACEDADAVVRLLPPLERCLEDIGATELYRKVEMPLVPVLAAMERAGIGLESDLLTAMGHALAAELDRLAAEIHKLAGGPFNINSPQQLQEVLFTELKLKPRRRTKTGYSTGQEVLEELATEHPLPAKILEFRQLTKLRGTYIEALPRLVDPATGRIHAEFHQTVAATGRLSSSNPNLQNIPIRTTLGREIRKAFVAPPACSLLSADYSQIELRLLAHLSGDEYLVRAFREGADIHRATAARVFGVAEDAVDEGMRARAKVVNFGVLYGMGAQRLAREQGMAVKEAAAFIAEYFAKLPGVKAYIDRCVNDARSRGYAETLLGRRRYLPDLQSARQQLRAAAERMAVNTPVQGSAADLIKLAMVHLHERLRAAFPDVALLIQVHDELVFAVPDRELDRVKDLVTREMTSVFTLNVPLRVDTGAGKTWFEAHA